MRLLSPSFAAIDPVLFGLSSDSYVLVDKSNVVLVSLDLIMCSRFVLGSAKSFGSGSMAWYAKLSYMSSLHDTLSQAARRQGGICAERRTG